jgi:thiamine biosynthesis lipoprotein
MKRFFFRVRFFPVFVIFLFGCADPPPWTEFVLDTVCSVNLYEGGKKDNYSAVFSRIRMIDSLMSAYRSDSDVGRINAAAGAEAVKVSSETIAILTKAIRYAELSGGAFDPTIGPLVKLWGIGSEGERIPEPEEIAGALDLVDWKDLIVDKEEGTAFLRRNGQALDLGAIAKGFAADEARAAASSRRVKRALIDLGGNILTLGMRRKKLGSARGPSGTENNFIPWRIGIQDPRDDRGYYLGILEVSGTKSIVTSGVYERYFEKNGRRYHHILSSETGCPVENGILSVSVITEYSVDADALATTLFALGYEKSLDLLRALPGIEALFVFDNNTIALTPGAAAIFTLTNAEYSLINWGPAG